MAGLPSYEDAISRSDWLDLAAPYFHIRSYSRLCLVSRRFYERFAQRLWIDPLGAARQLGLRRERDLNWYFKFVNRHVPKVRLETRSLVSILDFTGFAVSAAGFYSDLGEKSVSDSFRRLPYLFPRLRCILLDGHPEFDPGFLAKAVDADDILKGAIVPPFLLSLSSCRAQLPTSFFESRYLRSLIYLDLSDIPGSLKNALLQGTFSPQNLPSLRVLKARGREMDDSTAIVLFRTFAQQFWSLDLSRNNLTDAVVEYLLSYCFLPTPLRSESHFPAEGRITLPVPAGSYNYGPFAFIEESEWSASFSHPERYLVDAPAYFPETDRPPQDSHAVRLDGRARSRRDTGDHVKYLLTEIVGNSIPSISDVHHLDICQGQNGITHLYLNDNNFTLGGIKKLLRLSSGRLEHFECGSAAMELTESLLPRWMSRPIKVSGFIGGVDTVRPIISSNLQVLRAHHSLVTQTPTLEVENLMTMANIWLTETFLRPRVELAYPQAYVPDTNPRLFSLTLTNVPRYSTGPIIDKLLNFLMLASIQERGIQDASVPFSKRTPAVLRGLRHIRLEFEPDPKAEELGDSSGGEELNPEDLLNMAAEEFSFFGELGWGPSSPSPAASRRSSRATRPSDASLTCTASDTASEIQSEIQPEIQPEESQSQTEQSGRLDHPPFTETDSDHLVHTGTWNGQPFSIPVWIGPGVPGAHEAVNAYMHHLGDPALRTDVRPAAPAQIAAGVPEGTYIFQAAWDAMLAPEWEVVRRPTRSDVAAMHDVVAALKAYRAKTRAAYDAARRYGGTGGERLEEPHYFWTGKLEVELKDTMTHYHDSRFWR